MNHEDRHNLRADLLEQLDKDFNENQINKPDDYIHKELGQYAVEQALSEWRSNILEPVGEVVDHPILDYIQDGLEWTWIEEYENRKFAWCGAFVSFCYRDLIKKSIRYNMFASTYRLYKWAKETKRVIDGIKQARAGDIVIVGDKKHYGDHITLIEKIEDDLSGVWTIEGNAYGETPESTKRKEGVIRRFRPFNTIRYIYRPLEQDRNA